MQITKEQANSLIERLADKKIEVLERTVVDAIGGYVDVSLGHPIMLTDVLDKPEVVLCWEEEERKDRIYDLWCLWYECGVTKSLQAILDGAEWDQTSAKETCSPGETNYYIESMKGDAAPLFEYLISLFP